MNAKEANELAERVEKERKEEAERERNREISDEYSKYKNLIKELAEDGKLKQVWHGTTLLIENKVRLESEGYKVGYYGADLIISWEIIGEQQ